LKGDIPVHIYDSEPLAQHMVTLGPFLTFLFFLIADFGILAIMNLMDIKRRGMFNPKRGIGHWAYWMVVVYDTILMPGAAYMSVKFYQLTEPIEYGWVEYSIFVIATGIGIFAATSAVIRGMHRMRTDKEDRNWTTTEKGMNVYGWYHYMIFVLFAQYAVSFIFKGGWYLTYHGGYQSPEAIGWWLGGFVFFLVPMATIPIFVDENPKVPSPNTWIAAKISRFFGHEIKINI
jgi:hypothetical protein